MRLLESVMAWPVKRAAAAVIYDGEVVDSVGDPARRFPLASVTKLLTSYAVLLAVQEEAVGLDSPAGPAGSTVRHLLAHASGTAFRSRDGVRPPGERRIYSSAGYEWLAEVVERATDISFRDYLGEGLLRPLRMADSLLDGSAGHGACSTVADLARFVGELMHPRLLADELLAEATTVQFPGLRGVVPGFGMQRPCPWGLGFEIRGRKSPHWLGPGMPPETCGHFGMSGTYLWWEPEARIAVIVLTDRPFGPWAVPLWADTNDALWQILKAKLEHH